MYVFLTLKKVDQSNSSLHISKDSDIRYNRNEAAPFKDMDE